MKHYSSIVACGGEVVKCGLRKHVRAFWCCGCFDLATSKYHPSTCWTRIKLVSQGTFQLAVYKRKHGWLDKYLKK